MNASARPDLSAFRFSVVCSTEGLLRHHQATMRFLSLPPRLRSSEVKYTDEMPVYYFKSIRTLEIAIRSRSVQVTRRALNRSISRSTLMAACRLPKASEKLISIQDERWSDQRRPEIIKAAERDRFLLHSHDSGSTHSPSESLLHHQDDV